MKRNVSKLNKGEENSSIGIKENKIIHEQTQINNKKITLDKINQFNRTQRKFRRNKAKEFRKRKRIIRKREKRRRKKNTRIRKNEISHKRL